MSQEKPLGQVLIVDDVKDVQMACQTVLGRAGYEVTIAESGEIALELLKGRGFDAILLDNQLPGISGLELLPRLRQEFPNCEVIMMTAYGSFEIAVTAVKQGAYDFLTKPFKDLSLITHTVSRAIERKKLVERTRDLENQIRASFGRMVGSSPNMQKVFKTIQDISSSDITALITGESGTGKELVAQALHDKSPRRDKTFLALNCAALTDSLLESELFGHAKGAFTGAVSAKRGLFEAADKGTLFLDEIGDMPLATQVKLLRVLQEGEVRPVGGTEIRKVDVRLIAATNRNLAELVEKKQFRQDLFYRLNVISIELPALRERKDDIPLLANFFLQKFIQRYQKTVTQISPEVLAILEQYPWPGNVRELEHLIERAVVLCKSDSLILSDLPETLHQSGALVSVMPSLMTQQIPLYQEAKEQLLATFTLNYIRQLLDKTGGNMGKAAQLAGMERSNFRRLYDKYRQVEQTQNTPTIDSSSKVLAASTNPVRDP